MRISCDLLGRAGLWSAALTSLAWLGLSTAASAQGIQPPTRGELAQGRGESRDPRASRLSVDADIERGPCPLAGPAFADITVRFEQVQFTGLPDIPAAVLDPAWRHMAGRDLPIASLCDVRDRANAILADLGYLVAVQVPPQRIEAGGTVQIDVLAARLAEVEVRGEAGRAERLIAAHLDALTARPWFNVQEAERHLLLLQDMPGFDVRLTLRSAGGEPGALIGEVQVDRRPVELALGVQNLGTKATGRGGAFVELALNDLLGRGDRTTLSYFNTFDWSEQRIVRAAHELALDANGLRLGGSVLYGESRPDVAGGAFATETLAGDVHLTGNLVRRQAQSLWLTGGLELVDQAIDFGPTAFSKDKLRLAFARLDYSAVDPQSLRGAGGFSLREPRWRAAFSLQASQGTGLFGASSDCDPLADCLAPNLPISNLLADPTAFVVRLQGSAEFRPVSGVTLAVAPLAQVTEASLLAYEQVSLGNYTIGRGFDPGVALGDSAIGAALELRYGSLYSLQPGGAAFEPFVFLDYAKAWVNDDRLNPDPRDVLSAGAGLRARWGDKLDLSAVVAVPLKPAGFQTERSDPRFLLTLTTRLLPWGTRR